MDHRLNAKAVAEAVAKGSKADVRAAAARQKLALRKVRLLAASLNDLRGHSMASRACCNSLAVTYLQHAT